MRLATKFEPGGEQPEDRPREAEVPTGEPTPSHAARNLALAHHIERLVQRALVADYTAAARMLGVSQPRMTHLMGLLLLSPVIQEAILLGQVAPRDKELRVLARVAVWEEQELVLRQRDRASTPPVARRATELR